MAVARKAAGKSVRLENLRDFVIMDSEAVERLTQASVVRREQPRGLGLDGKMKIAHGPANDGRRFRFHIERNFQHWFRRLPDDIARLIARPYGVAVLQRRFDFKAEFRAIVGRGAPQALGEFLPVRANGDFRQRRIE